MPSPTHAELLSAIQQTNKNLAHHIKASDLIHAKLLAAIEDLSDYVHTNLVTNQQFQDLQHTVEHMATKMDKIESDHVAAIEWLRRHEERLDQHDVVLNEVAFNYKLSAN